MNHDENQTRLEKIEALKKLLAQVKEVKEEQEENLKNMENQVGSSEAKGKSKTLIRGNYKAAEEPIQTLTINDRRNGQIEALLLGVLSFVFELLFLGISYLIFR